MITIKPTLILGIGTTGVEILEELEGLWFITFGDTIPPSIKLVALDTDRKLAEPTPLGQSQIILKNISIDNTEGAVNVVKERLKRNPRWLDDIQGRMGRTISQIRSSSVGGAWNIRALGRLSLWRNIREIHNLLSDFLGSGDLGIINNTNIAKTNNYFRQKGDFQLDDQRQIAIVVGSLVGGTGSGTIIDLGYLLSNNFNLGDSTFGVFLAPMQPISTDQFRIVKLANAYATLQELLFYKEGGTPHSSLEDNDYGEGFRRDVKGRPYGLMYLCSGMHGRIPDLERVKKGVALKLFFNILGLSDALLTGKMTGGVNLEKVVLPYLSFGVYGFSNPKKEIAEAASCILGLEVIRRYTQNAIEEEVNQEVQEKFDSALIKFAETLAPQIDGQIQEEILKLKNKEYKSLDEFIATLKEGFEDGGAYFNLVEQNIKNNWTKNFELDFQKSILDGIREKKCVTWGYSALKELSKLNGIIDETIQHLNESKIPFDKDSWMKKYESSLDDLKKIPPFPTPGPSYLGKYYEVIEERISELLKVLKLYKLRTNLEDLKARLSRYQEGLEALISNLNSGVQALFKDRISQLKNAISRMDLIQPIWHSSNLEGDVKYVIAQFLSWDPIIKAELEIGVTDLNLFTNRLLSKVERNDWITDLPWTNFEAMVISKPEEQKRICNVIKDDLMRKVRSFLPQVNVAARANEMSRESLRFASRAAENFIELNPTKETEHSFVASCIFGSNLNQMQTLSERPELAKFRFMPFVIPGLDSWVLFYKEKSEIRLMEELNDEPQLKDAYENQRFKQDFIFDTFCIDLFQKEKEVRDLLEATLNVFVEYGKRGDKWAPEQSYSPTLFMVDSKGNLIFTPYQKDLGNPKESDEKCTAIQNELVRTLIQNETSLSEFKKLVISEFRNTGEENIRRRLQTSRYLQAHPNIQWDRYVEMLKVLR